METTLEVLLHCTTYYKPRNGHCFLACSGTNFIKVSTGTPFSSGTQAPITQIQLQAQNY